MAQDPSELIDSAPASPAGAAQSDTGITKPGDQEDAPDQHKLIDKDDFLHHQYDSLRTEILQNISTRYTIITITLTAFGASFVIQNTILPLLFPALALVMMNIYVANSNGTRQASDFIRRAIETQVTVDGQHALGAGEMSRIGWQTHRDDGKTEQELSKRYSAGKAIFFVSSLAASIAGTLFNSQASPDTRVWPGFIVISFVISALLAIPVFVRDATLVRWFEDRPSNEALVRRVKERLSQR